MVEFPRVPITELFRLKQGTYLKPTEMEETRSAEFPYPVYGANGVIGYANRKIIRSVRLLSHAEGRIAASFTLPRRTFGSATTPSRAFL